MRTKSLKLQFSDGRDLNLAIKKNKRSKNIRMALYNDERVIVTVPWWITFGVAERFVRDKMEWLETHIKIKKDKKKFEIPASNANDYNRYKYRALKLAKERLEYFNQFYNFKYNKISIRNTRSRWGSCSSTGNLNFHYRIVLLPEEHRDYIIVHELCHLQEFNHSRNFWKLVEKTIPNYRGLVRDLKNV